MVVSAICMTIFVGALAASTQYTQSLAVACVCLGSFFVGVIEAISFSTAPLCLEPEDIGLSAGMLGSVRSALSTIATTIYIAILTNKQKRNIYIYVDSTAVQAGVSQGELSEVLAGFAAGKTIFGNINSAVIELLHTAYQTAYSHSFKVVYLSSVAFGACSIIAALYTPNMEDKFNDQVSRRLHGNDIAKKEKDMEDVGPSGQV
jgi:hypothetical protein